MLFGKIFLKKITVVTIWIAGRENHTKYILTNQDEEINSIAMWNKRLLYVCALQS